MSHFGKQACTAQAHLIRFVTPSDLCCRQSVLIAALVKLEVIKKMDTTIFRNVKDVANALQVIPSQMRCCDGISVP